MVLYRIRAFQNLVSEHSCEGVTASLYNLTKSIPDPWGLFTCRKNLFLLRMYCTVCDNLQEAVLVYFLMISGHRLIIMLLQKRFRSACHCWIANRNTDIGGMIGLRHCWESQGCLPTNIFMILHRNCFIIYIEQIINSNVLLSIYR